MLHLESWGRKRTYEDEDPSPTSIPSNAFHLPNPERQNPTKSSCERRSREEQRDSIVRFSALVPHGQVENDAGEETRLCDAKEESSDDEAGEVVRDAEESRDDAPGEHESWKPYFRRGALEDDVAGNFEENLGVSEGFFADYENGRNVHSQ